MGSGLALYCILKYFEDPSSVSLGLTIWKVLDEVRYSGKALMCLSINAVLPSLLNSRSPIWVKSSDC